MSDWQDLPLGDVLTLQRGFDLPARARVPGRFSVVSSSGVTGSHAEYKVEPPGVVIGRYGSLGSVHWITERYWPLNTSLWVKDFKGNDPLYLRYLMETVSVDGSTASAVPGVNRNHLHRTIVRLPPVALQRRIALFLSTFDKLIAINERRIELLEDLARSLYREWFARLRFPGSSTHGEPRGAELPPGWSWRPATALIEVNPRIRARQDAFRKVAMGDLDERYSTVAPSASVVRAAGSKFENDDVLFARITPCLQNGKTGLVKFLAKGEVGIGSTEFIVLRGVGVGPAFVYCAARSSALRGHAIKSMSGATGRQRVSADCFETVMMVAPPRSIADAFERTVGPMMEEVADLARQSCQLAATRDLLLPRLVTGRLDISEIDLDILLDAEAA